MVPLFVFVPVSTKEPISYHLSLTKVLCLLPKTHQGCLLFTLSLTMLTVPISLVTSEQSQGDDDGEEEGGGEGDAGGGEAAVPH